MKIENGCLAVVTNSSVPENVGKCVRVIKFIGYVEGICGANGKMHEDMWEIDTPTVCSLGRVIYAQREANMMRIDGIKEPETTLKIKSLNNSEV